MDNLNSVDLKPHRFEVAIPERNLNDLLRRLIATKWPGDDDNHNWQYGVNQTYLQELVDYWLTDFDWRSVEKKINGFPHYRIVIDGVPIHFLYKKGRGSHPIPIILTHGWPWTFWDMHKLIGPLTDPVSHGYCSDDAFDVIIPSLPGYGFSSPAFPREHIITNAMIYSPILPRRRSDSAY